MIELTHAEAGEIAQRYGSPFYIFDPVQFRNNIQRFSAAMASRYSPFILGYSYKTNYLPAACLLVKQQGGYAEVVSRLEYDLARRLGYEHGNIIFNGPLKKQQDLGIAFSGGAIVNLDSMTEVTFLCDWVKKHPGVRPLVGLRININLTGDDGKSRVQDGLKAGRFGFSGGNLDSAVEKLAASGVELVSLHGHSSSNDRSVENFRTICSTLCSVREHYSLDKLRYFNVGGGFFGNVPKQLIGREVPTFDMYAAAIAETLLADPWVRENRPTLVAEPGVSVVADSMSFYTKIHSRKTVANEKNFITVDGSVFNVKPTMHPYNMLYRYLPAQTVAGEELLCDVVGSTCMEKDVILREILLPDPQPGDYIEIRNTGAYTIVMTPPFINLAPAIVAPDGKGGFELLREAQSVDQFLACYNLRTPAQ